MEWHNYYESWFKINFGLKISFKKQFPIQIETRCVETKIFIVIGNFTNVRNSFIYNVKIYIFIFFLSTEFDVTLTISTVCMYYNEIFKVLYIYITFFNTTIEGN